MFGLRARSIVVILVSRSSVAGTPIGASSTASATSRASSAGISASGTQWSTDDAPHRAPRHGREEGVVRVLDDGQPALPLDRREAGGAVVERAGEDHADHVTAVVARPRTGRADRPPADGGSPSRSAPCGPGRPRAPCAGRGRDVDAPALEGHCPPRRVAGGWRAAGPRARSARAGCCGPSARRGARMKTAAGRVRRQAAGEGPERLDAARRRPDHDDVASASCITIVLAHGQSNSARC